MQPAIIASRLATGICGTVVGAYCAYTAFRNGQTLASGVDGIAFGSAFAAVVVGSWFLLPLAAHSPKGRAALMRLGWALCLAFVLINAIGFTATHRTMVVGEKTNTITAYDTALAGLAEARAALTAMKANWRWASTSGCTDATVERSITFCADHGREKAKADGYQALVAAGKPATADAQADTIAWVMRADSMTIARAMPIFMAVVLDIAASLFIWAALTVYASAETAVARPKAKAKAKKKTTKRWTPAMTQKLLQQAVVKPDRRTMRARNSNIKTARPANENIEA